jgi:hypothetical protein
MDLVNPFLERAFQDKAWTESYKAATEICLLEVMSNYTAIQAKHELEPFLIPRNECDVKFMAVHSCVNLETFIVSRKFKDASSNKTFLISELSQEVFRFI